MTNAKEVARIAAGTETLAETEKVRRGKDYTPFNGAVNPYIEAETTPAVTYLPRAGTPLEAPMPETATRTLTATRAAMVLRERLGEAWQPAFFEFLQQRYTEGISEAALERLAEQWAQSAAEVRHVAAG